MFVRSSRCDSRELSACSILHCSVCAGICSVSGPSLLGRGRQAFEPRWLVSGHCVTLSLRCTSQRTTFLQNSLSWTLADANSRLILFYQYKSFFPLKDYCSAVPSSCDSVKLPCDIVMAL